MTTPISSTAQKLRSALRCHRGLRLTPEEVQALAEMGVAHIIWAHEADELVSDRGSAACQNNHSESAPIGFPSGRTVVPVTGTSHGMTQALEQSAANRHVQQILKKLRA